MEKKWSLWFSIDRWALDQQAKYQWFVVHIYPRLSPRPFLQGRGGGDIVLTCAVSHVVHWLLDPVMGFVDVK